MDITFRTRQLEKMANDSTAARKAFGTRCAGLLRRRLDDLRAATNLEEMRHLPGRCHELKADRAGQLAIDLEHPKRLVFVPTDENCEAARSLDWSSVTSIEIVEIVDYH